MYQEFFVNKLTLTGLNVSGASHVLFESVLVLLLSGSGVGSYFKSCQYKKDIHQKIINILNAKNIYENIFLQKIIVELGLTTGIGFPVCFKARFIFLFSER